MRGNKQAKGKKQIDYDIFVPPLEVAAALHMTYQKVVQAIESGALPIGIVVPPEGDKKRAVVRIYRKTWDEYREAKGI